MGGKKKKEEKGEVMVNEVCKDCLKWKQFGEQCWVHWKLKKYCTQKVFDEDEWSEQEKLLK